jgi:hypothetical protein
MKNCKKFQQNSNKNSTKPRSRSATGPPLQGKRGQGIVSVRRFKDYGCEFFTTGKRDFRDLGDIAKIARGRFLFGNRCHETVE